MSDRIRVAETSDLDHGDRAFVEIDGHEVGVVNYQGNYYAFRNRCPHQYGPVCEGLVRGQLVADWGDVGERTTETIDENQGSVSCPKHGWEFDIESGHHVGDPSIQLDTYETTVEDSVVYVLPND